MEFSFHTTFNSTQQQHVQKHYSCISRPQKFYVKIRSQKLDLYTSIYSKSFAHFYTQATWKEVEKKVMKGRKSLDDLDG